MTRVAQKELGKSRKSSKYNVAALSWVFILTNCPSKDDRAALKVVGLTSDSKWWG